MRFYLPFLLILLCTVQAPEPPRRHFSQLPPVGSEPQIAGQDLAPSTLILKSNTTCEVGELVRLDASASDVTGFAWEILPSTPDFEVIEEGRRAFFSARKPGSYLFILAGAKDGQPYLLHHRLTVVDQTSTASLEYKIKQAYDKVASEKKQEEAKAVVAVFRTLSATEFDVQTILEATAKANKEALGDALTAWIPFLDALGKELDAYVAAGTLTTREQYQQVWSEIANSLEKAAA